MQPRQSAKEASSRLAKELDQGVSQSKAESIAKENGAGTIDKVTMGYFQDQPIWEVKSGGTYYLIGFESGQLVSKEGL